MKKFLFYFTLALFLLLLVFGYQYFKFNDGRLHIVICDVGQGDGIFIRTPLGEDIVIDGGPDDKILSCLSSHMPLWDRTIELVILTHPDADHSTGIVDVIKRYQVASFETEKAPGKTQIYNKLLTTLAEKRLSARYLYQGDKFSEKDGMEFLTLWPTPQDVDDILQKISNKNISLNILSVTQLLKYKNFKALFTGDEPSEVGDRIAPLAGKIDLLKVPHHGSRTGMDYNYLAQIHPSLAVISVGARNKYGHPTEFSLDLLKAAGAKILRTDQNGEVEIISDGETWSYKVER